MRRTKGNISHFLSQMLKQDAHQTECKGSKILNTGGGQARLDSRSSGSTQRGWTQRTENCSRALKSSQSTFAVCLDWVGFGHCLLTHSREVIISWFICTLQWNNHLGGGCSTTGPHVVNSTHWSGLLTPGHVRVSKTGAQQWCFHLANHRQLSPNEIVFIKSSHGRGS